VGVRARSRPQTTPPARKVTGVQTDFLIAGLLGLLVATSGLLAYRLSERAQRPAPPEGAGADPDSDVAAILGALPLTSILLDADGELQRVSPEAYTSGLVRAGSLALPEVTDLVATVRADGVPASRQVRWQRADGNDIVFDIHAAPLSNSRVIVLGHDLTAELRLDETRRDFVANVSHELKTPVGAISLLAETVAAAADDPEAVRRFAERMEVESTRLAALIEDIIDLSRLQSPETKIAIRPVPLQALLYDARDSVSVEAERRGAHVFVEDSPHIVLGDRDLLFTAVRNLIDNAVRYGPEGGQVTVSTRETGDAIDIRVADQGSGITDVDRERVFERFYRVDQARSRNTGGTGLGLSIVKHVAANHGGNVTVWSKAGEGSTFTLRIPRADERASA